MITAENIFDNFKLTMSGLEKGLQVIHITTPAAKLLCCQDDDDIETVLLCDDLKPFDQIPVKKQETIIGLLKKRECPEGAKGAAGDHMQKLGERILVSADTPLLKFIQDESLDRIVISGMNIYGLVTKSDLLKLPVFLLGFALVTHVEALMLHMIRETSISNETWLTWVGSKNRGDIKNLFAKLSSERSEPEDMLELSYFSDKSKILEQLAGLEEYTSHVPAKFYIDQLKEITELRNTIAHSRKASDNDDFLQQFIDRLLRAHTWIEVIEQWQKAKAITTD